MMIMIMSVRTKPSGLYRHRRGLGLHRVSYREGDLHVRIAKLAFHAKESPIRTWDEVFSLDLHSPTVRQNYIVRLSEDPLIQDFLSLCVVGPLTDSDGDGDGGVLRR